MRARDRSSHFKLRANSGEKISSANQRLMQLLANSDSSPLLTQGAACVKFVQCKNYERFASKCAGPLASRRLAEVFSPRFSPLRVAARLA
jgi:hypothetical protein